MPEKERSPDVSETVRGDEDGKQPVDPVDVGILRLGDLDDDEADEADVGEGGVDGPVEGHPPLLAEPGGGGRLVALGGEEARIEERVEEEQEVAGHLHNEIKQKTTKPNAKLQNLLEDMHHPGEHGHVDPDGVTVRVELVIHLRLSWHQHK